MVSIKELAARCGVSTATVSKALNGQPDVGEETRRRIRRIADEMGYLPNAAARSLKTNRTYSLGVLFVDQTQSGLRHEYFSGVLEAFKSAAESHGYDITFITQNIGGKPSTYLMHCRQRSVDGVMVASIDFNDPQVLELVNSGLPLVTIDHVFNNRMAIVSDNVGGMEALVRHVYAKGHRRLAFIHGEMTTVTENRLASFWRTCGQLGIRVPEEYVLGSAYHDVEQCAAAVRRLLALPKRPTCIFLPDDFSSLGGYNALRDAGLSIPGDVSVVGYDGIYLSQVMAPRLTTYQQDTVALGRLAAEQLIAMIEAPRSTVPDRILVPGRLLEGDSVAAI
jgi:LacI family transcriptional regulator